MILATRLSLHLSTTPLVGPSHNFSESEIMRFKTSTRHCVGSWKGPSGSKYSARNEVAASDKGCIIVAVLARATRLAQKSVRPGGLPFGLRLGGAVAAA